MVDDYKDGDRFVKVMFELPCPLEPWQDEERKAIVRQLQETFKDDARNIQIVSCSVHTDTPHLYVSEKDSSMTIFACKHIGKAIKEGGP